MIVSDVQVCMVGPLLYNIFISDQNKALVKGQCMCLKLPNNNPIENIFMRFSKDLLGGQRQTTNIGVIMELGQTPLTLYARKNCIKNWERISLHKNENDIIKISCE